MQAVRVVINESDSILQDVTMYRMSHNDGTFYL
jgi:hypothetical protein